MLSAEQIVYICVPVCHDGVWEGVHFIVPAYVLYNIEA